MVCADDEIALSATGAVSYTWEPGGLVGANVNLVPMTNTSFTLFGTDANGCVNSSALTLSVSVCEGITKIGSESGNQLTIFPNPATGTTIIELPSELHNALLEVTDQKGNKLRETKINWSRTMLTVQHL
jgi:hypothetical protein